jgi:quinol monooxygenase YgiN
MLTVIAHYRTLPGQDDKAAAILGAHTAATLAEPGCVRFIVNLSQADPERFVLYEQYADAAAFQAHRQTRHFREYIEQSLVPLLIEREWQRYAVIGADH